MDIMVKIMKMVGQIMKCQKYVNYLQKITAGSKDVKILERI